MIEPLIHFAAIQPTLGLQTSRAVRALCQRYNIPIVKLNARQLALRAADYTRLLAKMSGEEAA